MIIRILNHLFPRHQSTIIIRHYQWKPYCPQEEFLRGAQDIYEVERRMRDSMALFISCR
jgi:hypothetical protein